ncbi:MAG: hypothetical protein QM783_10860 [Phycisphaerales bacterium]
MTKNVIVAALAAGCVAGVASRARATDLPFSTGFESNQGYASGSQLSTNANWNGDGQDTSGWTVTTSTVNGTAAASGTQWVLASSPTVTTAGGSIPTRFQWTVTPVTDFTTNPVMVGAADVRLLSPSSGTLNRTTIAGISMYNANIDIIASMYLMMDVENTVGLGANRMYIQFIWGDGSDAIYDLNQTSTLGQYYHLELSANMATGVVRGSVNGQLLPQIGNTGGATDFHDFDMSVEVTTSTVGGQRARAGFDNYSIAQVPAPAAAALAGLAGATLARRRARNR